jgi:Ribonuclease G/E
MQSAFVDIGLDGDAFLYVSDVFENLEDYDHGHAHEPEPVAVPANGGASHVEALPGETIGHSGGAGNEAHPAEFAAEPGNAAEAGEIHTHVEEAEPGAPGVDEARLTDSEVAEEERQPDSNESAPQNSLRVTTPRSTGRPSHGPAMIAAATVVEIAAIVHLSDAVAGAWSMGGRQRQEWRRLPSGWWRDLPPSTLLRSEIAVLTAATIVETAVAVAAIRNAAVTKSWSAA